LYPVRSAGHQLVQQGFLFRRSQRVQLFLQGQDLAGRTSADLVISGFDCGFDRDTISASLALPLHDQRRLSHCSHFIFRETFPVNREFGLDRRFRVLGDFGGYFSFGFHCHYLVLSSSSALVNGQIPHYDPVSGNSYLARLTAAVNQAGTLLLLDRLWHNGGYTISSTSAQASTTPTWPSRCPTSGTDDTATTTGLGVMLAVEVSAAVGAGTPTITIAYTNSAGTASRTATNILATSASVGIGVTYFIGLQAGDVGVRSVQSLTLSATWTSGTINLVAYRVIAALEVPQANVSNAVDAVTSGMPRIYNGAVPYLVFVPNTTTAALISGTYIETQG